MSERIKTVKMEKMIFCPVCGAWLNYLAKHRVMTDEECYAIDGIEGCMEIEYYPVEVEDDE